MSVSQQQAIPSQVPNTASPSVAQVQSPLSANNGTPSPHAAAPASSYANATKRSAVGNSAHSKSDSVTGKGAIPPAVPALGGPTIVNGNHAMSSISQGDHGRKPSVTISAAGASGHTANGGPVGGKQAGGNGIQFGSLNNPSASPAASISTPQPGQMPNSLAVSSPSNPRITSPQTSPSPIPQPPASGGRPPSSLQAQGNGLSFGSLGGDDPSRPYRQSMPPGALGPAMQATHLRRESSQSAHGDMGNPAIGPNGGRGGFSQQGGRGRGFGPPYPQQMPYSPNASFRPPPNQPRGGQNMGNQYQNRGQPLAPPYPGPHPGGRSPSLPNAQPINPQQGQMTMPSPQMQPNAPFGGYPQHMGPPQGQYGVAYDYGYYPYMPQHPNMQFIPPSSPRPPYGHPQGAQQHYIPGQYSNQPASMSMSRTSSAVSDRPVSAVGQPQTPMAPAVSHPSSANRGANSPAPKSANFQIPGRKNAGVAIKDPNSGAVKTFDKPLASPAPPSKSPAIISGTPTPPPGTPSHESQHARGESKAVKTDEEKKNDMKDAIARKIEADKEEERRKKAEEEAKLKEAAQAEEAAKAEAAKAEAARAEAAKAEGERAATAAAAAAAAREAETEIASKLSAEEEAERLRREEDEMFAEMERQEQEAEERYQKKRAAEKAERERQAVEAAAREEEDLKQQERAAEAAEEARLKKLEETEGDDKRERVSLFEALKDKQPAATPLAPSAAIDTPAASGAATPVSDSSAMGPPPARTIGGGKSKPAALKLETSKTVEAPQPSAALMSLRSARFLTIIDDATYPPSIASPNPALNANAPMGRFRYDINFLTQFQPVFVEKPSETWTQKVKETVGDTSETPASARGARPSGTMSSRASSQRGNVFSGAPFGVLPVFGGGPRPIPAGTTSAQRFEASTKGPIRYNANAPGGFPMGFAPQMARTASSSSMGHPQSPRNSTSHRGTGGRGSKGGKPQRENDKDAKTMPLTAGMDLKPIEISATGWKPRSVGANAAGMAGPPPGGDGYLAPDVVQRKVKAALNKMTPSTFDKISTQILDIVAQSKKETDGRTLRQVIQLTFEKATDEAHWAQMYAEFCSRMLAHMTPEIRDESMPLDKAGNVTAGGTLFRKYLLNRCQQDFEAGWKAKLPEKPEGESQEAAMLSDAYYVAAAAKRRGLGLVRFIGELFKLSMLTPRIMHMCVRRLVDFDGMPDEAEVESLTGLLKTIGENLDGEEKSRQLMDAYFDRIKAMEAVEGLPSRLKFMLMDIIDLRKKGWKSRDTATKGPVTLEEIKLQAAAADREKESQRAAENSRRGGGGGNRMNLGRGDARNFSGGNQLTPPPDYQKNTVGMEDLRRLGNRNNSRQASQQGTISLGPSSMFNGRGSNNARKGFGPGMLGRGGEDSGASSRTATPPAQKKEREEKEAAHQNAFSALAGLDTGEAADPTSPPSSASSPPVAKAKTLLERTRSKSPRSKSPLAQGKDGDKA